MCVYVYMCICVCSYGVYCIDCIMLIIIIIGVCMPSCITPCYTLLNYIGGSSACYYYYYYYYCYYYYLNS